MKEGAASERWRTFIGTLATGSARRLDAETTPLPHPPNSHAPTTLTPLYTGLSTLGIQIRHAYCSRHPTPTKCHHPRQQLPHTKS